MAITAISQSVNITVGSTLTEIGAAIAADAKINVYIVNKTGSTGNFRLAISPASPLGGEYLYYEFPLKSSGTFIAADVYAKATDKVWIYCPTGWSARVDGATLL
jgi:hypothetical protein